jgi:hypothetical protein
MFLPPVFVAAFGVVSARQPFPLACFQEAEAGKRLEKMLNLRN